MKKSAHRLPSRPKELYITATEQLILYAFMSTADGIKKTPRKEVPKNTARSMKKKALYTEEIKDSESTLLSMYAASSVSSTGDVKALPIIVPPIVPMQKIMKIRPSAWSISTDLKRLNRLSINLSSLYVENSVNYSEKRFGRKLNLHNNHMR